jgi:hypothetical protein
MAHLCLTCSWARWYEMSPSGQGHCGWKPIPRPAAWTGGHIERNSPITKCETYRLIRPTRGN